MMFDYETLDSIADAYVPLLALMSLAALGVSAARKRWLLLGKQTLLLFIGLAIAYGFMFVDVQFGLWPSLGHDYSTHTAVALMLVLFLCVASRKWWPILIASLAGYFALMVYQGYHSMADILTTGLVVAAGYLPAILWYRRSLPRSVGFS